AHPFDGPALQSKAGPVALAVVARRPPETEHRIFLDRLEGPPTDQVGVLVRLEVAHTDDGRLGKLGGGNLGDASGQMLDKVFGLGGGAAGLRVGLSFGWLVL